MNEERLIVTMTSWKDRINNVVPILTDLLTHTTLQPDKVVINLSSTEFTDGLPTELTEFVESHPQVEIHWIDGPNTRQWKKIIPTLLRYPNDMVVCIDDDFVYHPMFLRSLYDAHQKYPDGPVTTNQHYRVKGKLQHCGAGTLDKLSYYEGLGDIDLTEFYEKASSDTFFTLLAHDRGHEIHFVGCNINRTPYNAVSPLTKSEGTGKTDKHLEMYDLMVQKGLIKPID